MRHHGIITKQHIRTQTYKTWRKRHIYVREKYQEPEDKIKQKAEAANSDLKQNKEKIAETMEAEAKQENEKKAVAQMVKAEAEPVT